MVSTPGGFILRSLLVNNQSQYMKLSSITEESS